ncbi:MAG: hypothetical protein RLN78_00850 [Phycisphaerales bacterium]
MITELSYEAFSVAEAIGTEVRLLCLIIVQMLRRLASAAGVPALECPCGFRFIESTQLCAVQTKHSGFGLEDTLQSQLKSGSIERIIAAWLTHLPTEEV